LQHYGQYHRDQQKEQCNACKLNFLFIEKQLGHSIEVIDKEKTQKQKGLDKVNPKRTPWPQTAFAKVRGKHNRERQINERTQNIYEDVDFFHFGFLNTNIDSFCQRTL
jgi:hypothetical protein